MFRVLFIAFIFLIISFYYNGERDKIEPLTNQNSMSPPKKDSGNHLEGLQGSDGSSRPAKGLSTYIGRPDEALIDSFGPPDRKDPSAYGFEWWVYNSSEESYMQAGIRNGEVVTVYALGDDLNLHPYKIGQTIEEIYRTTLLETEMLVSTAAGSYRFELSEEDLNLRPLVQLDDIYAQLSLDKYTGTLMSVRFLEPEILIGQHPYEMEYQGDLESPAEPGEEEWARIDRGSERQIFDMTNILRAKHGMPALEWDAQLAEIAYGHSKDMAENGYFAHESPLHGDLASRLINEEVKYQAASENIAAEYADGPAAVEGWMNSEGHRKVLLDKEVTKLGVGVYKKYYTQNFIKID